MSSLMKLSFGGPLIGTESWTCGLHIWDPAPVSGNFDEVLLSEAISQWFLRPASLNSNLASLEYFKYNEINSTPIGTGLPGGKYTNPGTPHAFFYPVVRQGPAEGGPPQLSLAVSTVTAKVRGRGSKGRWFPPTAVANNALTGGVVGGSMPAAAATSAAQLITDVNGAVGGSCVVYSFIGQTNNEIIAVRVGQVLDTQRRRRRSLPELYVSAARA